MLLEALWNFHVYGFPILKFYMQECPPLMPTTCANMVAITTSISTILRVCDRQALCNCSTVIQLAWILLHLFYPSFFHAQTLLFKLFVAKHLLMVWCKPGWPKNSFFALGPRFHENRNNFEVVHFNVNSLTPMGAYMRPTFWWAPWLVNYFFTFCPLKTFDS